MSKETSLAALDNCFTDFSDLIQVLVKMIGIQSLCPDWDIRGVVTHLAGIEDLYWDGYRKALMNGLLLERWQNSSQLWLI